MGLLISGTGNVTLTGADHGGGGGNGGGGGGGGGGSGGVGDSGEKQATAHPLLLFIGEATSRRRTCRSALQPALGLGLRIEIGSDLSLTLTITLTLTLTLSRRELQAALGPQRNGTAARSPRRLRKPHNHVAEESRRQHEP